MIEYNSYIAFLHPEQSMAGSCPQICTTFNDMALFRLGKIHSSSSIRKTTLMKVGVLCFVVFFFFVCVFLFALFFF